MMNLWRLYPGCWWFDPQLTLHSPGCAIRFLSDLELPIRGKKAGLRLRVSVGLVDGLVAWNGQSRKDWRVFRHFRHFCSVFIWKKHLNRCLLVYWNGENRRMVGWCFPHTCGFQGCEQRLGRVSATTVCGLDVPMAYFTTLGWHKHCNLLNSSSSPFGSCKKATYLGSLLWNQSWYL